MFASFVAIVLLFIGILCVYSNDICVTDGFIDTMDEDMVVYKVNGTWFFTEYNMSMDTSNTGTVIVKYWCDTGITIDR